MKFELKLKFLSKTKFMRSTKLLIDGYNLLFQSQLVGRGRGQRWLEKARGRLLQLLVNKLTELERRETTIVFDAAERPDDLSSTLNAHEIEVLFANEYDEADDLLEEMIRQAPQPKLLRVVSSDQRVRKCARARRAQSIDADSFLNELETRLIQGPTIQTPLSPAQTPSHQKVLDDDEGASPLSDQEVDYWMREFRQDMPKPE